MSDAQRFVGRSAVALFALLAVVVLSLAGPAAAGPSEAQFGELKEPLLDKVTVDLIGTPLPRALETLARESEANIMIAPQFIDKLSGESITLTIRDLPTAKALNLIGLATGADWYIQDGVILFATSSYVRSLNVQTRMFDIGELLESVPDFHGKHLSLDGTFSNTSSGGSNAGYSGSYGKGGGGGGGLFGSDSDTAEDLPSRDELVDQITGLITSMTGDSQDWLDEIYTVTEFNNNLIVRATPQVNEQVAELLTRLSGTSGRMVVVEGQYFAVPRRLVDELDGSLVMDAQKYKKFAAKLGRGAENVRRLAAGRTVCFNGQRVYVYAATEEAMLSDVEPVPDSFSVDPTLSTLHKGAVLDIKPTITLDGKQVSVALRTDVVDHAEMDTTSLPVGSPPAGAERVSTSGSITGEVKLEDGTTAPVTGTVNGGGTTRGKGKATITGEAELGLPEQEMVSLRTNVRIPDGGAVVLSGVSNQFDKTDSDAMEIILVLRVRIAE